MQASLAGRRGWSARGGRLILALALCACGAGEGGEDRAGKGRGERGDAPAPPSADRAGAPADSCSAAAAANRCPAAPPAYAASLLTGPWNALVARLAADGVTFPRVPGNDTTVEMKLCASCAKVSLRIHSSHLAPCLGARHLTGEPRILAMFTVQDDVPAQHGWAALSSGDSVFVFVSAADGPAMLVHNSGGTGRMAPSDAMRFRFCADGHPSGPPQAQSRKRPPPDDDDAFVWVKCDCGCCIMHVPPKGPPSCG